MGEFWGLLYCLFPCTSGLGQELRCKKQPLNVGGLGAWELLSVISPLHYYPTILIVLAMKSAVIASGQILLTYGPDSWTRLLHFEALLVSTASSHVASALRQAFGRVPGTSAPFSRCTISVPTQYGKVSRRSRSTSAPFVSCGTRTVDRPCPGKDPDTLAPSLLLLLF